METCDYILYQPCAYDRYGYIGPEFVCYDDALNSTVLSEIDDPSSCNTAFTFWLGADALYEVGG